ncbi:hypothetical protein [Calothrix sp. PCC 7507]|uniref:hypothetical protein n=1 Tax=Calothrix sp. PCC 7507 TaxID=99598 RepID=UPI00029F223B|nr:hypothetical protein [Calothrix sp. PCC 7507]AFY31364.1 hypothetical protein Cal7507_0883 [Calothrix sp. PCC 7507]
MNQVLNIQEIAIALTIQPQNHSVLTLDFLKSSGIVPQDWELARPSVLNQTAAQFVFINGVAIAAQPNRILFSQQLTNQEINAVSVGAIARKYLETLPEIEYQGINTSFRGHVAFDPNRLSARDYIVNILLAPGAGKTADWAPIQTTIQFTYRLSDALLVLEIHEAGLRVSDQEVVPVVVFTGSFARGLTHEITAEQRVGVLARVSDRTSQDLQTYQDLICNNFLQLVV